MLLGVFPLLLIAFLMIQELSRMREIQESLTQLRYETLLKDKKQAFNVAVRRCFKDADHFYIDKHLETLVFLEPEIEGLQKILAEKNAILDEGFKKRLDFLTHGSNNLTFSEGVVQKFPFFHETLETLVHPVEINSQDLQKILARIEGVTIGPMPPGPGRPQLLITEFKLDKKKISERNEVYLLNLKLLKREFL